MINLLWVAINLIGIVILALMYTYMSKAGKEITREQKSFRIFQIVIILYLLFDAGMDLIDAQQFAGALTINYALSMLHYLTLPFIGFLYFLYCNYCVNKNDKISKKLIFIYFVPVILNAVAVFLTPGTNLLFIIDEGNKYLRGDFFWITFAIALIYVLATYILLLLKSNNKREEANKNTDVFLYLFPILPVLFGILQVFYYGTSLIGIGFIVAALVMYIRNITSSDEKHSLSVRFFLISIAQFGTVFIIMVVGLFLTLDSAIDDISEDYAIYNSINTANTLKVYLSKEISVLETTVKSGAVIDWFENEDDPQLRERGLDELFKSIDVLYNNNLFIVIEESRQGFAVTGGEKSQGISEPLAISRDNNLDKWYFELMEQPEDYFLDVDIYNDNRAVWLNFKVQNENGDFIGALSTDMDMSSLTEHTISQYRDNNTRVFLIDKYGNIHVDSEFIDGADFLLYGFDRNVRDEFTDLSFLAQIDGHLASIDGYFDEFKVESQIFKLQHSQYHYATITPVGLTDWTVIKLFDSTSLFATTRLLPPFIIITALFILFVFTSNSELRRLIFNPLRLLVDSLVSMKGRRDKNIYGLERDDELGLVSNTIHELFIVGHFDALTGIYNRRYMEESLKQVISTLSRANSRLSLLMMDIDNFKKYNDTYGHSAGDDCLKQVAGALESVVKRDGDFVARYGGEEFIAALPNTDEAGAVLVAEGILKAVMDLNIPHEKNGGGIVTISIGVVSQECLEGQTWNDFVKMADEALYESKENGRNRYTVYE